MRRVTVDPLQPDPSALLPLIEIIRQGGVVAIPTDTLYGLAADPFNARAVERLFEIKQRPHERAVPLVAADLSQVRAWLGELPAAGARLAARFWPGRLTLLVHAPPRLAAAVTGGLGTIGVRVPDHAAARALAAACGMPLTATSANLSGEPPTADPDEVARQLGAGLDALLDAGPVAGGLPSTIVDVTRQPPTLVRAGAVPWKEVGAWLHE